MPFKSQAQRRWMWAAESRGEVPRGTARRWQRETGDRRLPERKKMQKSAAFEAAVKEAGIRDAVKRMAQRGRLAAPGLKEGEIVNKLAFEIGIADAFEKLALSPETVASAAAKRIRQLGPGVHPKTIGRTNPRLGRLYENAARRSGATKNMLFDALKRQGWKG